MEMNVFIHCRDEGEQRRITAEMSRWRREKALAYLSRQTAEPWAAAVLRQLQEQTAAAEPLVCPRWIHSK